MIELADVLVGWLVSVVGDAGMRLVRTTRDERRLRSLMNEALGALLAALDPVSRSRAERAIAGVVATPGRLRPAPGQSLTEALHGLIRTRLEECEQADAGGGDPTAAPVPAEGPSVSERVISAVVTAMREYVAVSGITELVHRMDNEEVVGKLDALSLQIEGLTVAAQAAATFTLPRDIASFTGRVADLRRLLDACTRPAASTGHVFGLHAIDGMAGIGKTALAVHAAHLLADRFPDGQIYLHLHGHTPGQLPVDPGSALETLLVTVGVPPVRIPREPEARAALWRDYVSTRRILILLDDAVSSDQVRPLLPGSAQSLVLVTSRRRLTALDEVVSMSLDTLAPGEAGELFARLAARPSLTAADPVVAEVVRLCGYLPLAIRLTAAQLAHHASWTIEELAADLASTRNRVAEMHAETDSVTSAFDLSYHDLTQDQRLVFRRLGLHVGSEFDAYIASALTGFPLTSARRLLDELFLHHIIEEPGRGRYRMHDLIRQQSRDLAAADGTEENRVAIHRLLDYFAHTAAVAARHLGGRMQLQPLPTLEFPPAWVPELPTAKEALRWLQAERVNLHSAVDYASSHTLLEHAVFIPSAVQHFLRSQGYWDQAITLQTAARTVAGRVNDSAGEALALQNLGQVHRMSGEYPASIACLERALALHGELGDRLSEATDLHELGLVQRLSGDYEADRASQLAAQGIYRELGNSLGAANTAHELGVMQWLVGDLEEALATHTMARDLYRENANEYGLAHAYNELAVVQNSAGRYPAAAGNLVTALEMHRRLGNRHGEGYALMFLGTLHYLTGDYPASLETLREAVDLDLSLGNRYAMAFALRELGVAQLRSGDLEGALSTLVQSVAVGHEIGNRYGEGCALTALGRARTRAGQYEEAAASLAEAVRIHAEFGHRLAEADALIATGELSLARGSADEARERLTAGLEAARGLGAPLEQGLALVGLAGCAAAVGEAGQRRTLLTEALEIFRRIGAPEAAEVEAALSP